MPVTVLIFAKFARNKPATLLKYELLSEVLQTLQLDNKKPFFGRSCYLVTASVYISQVSKRWLKFLCFQDHCEKDQHADNV